MVLDRSIKKPPPEQPPTDPSSSFSSLSPSISSRPVAPNPGEFLASRATDEDLEEIMAHREKIIVQGYEGTGVTLETANLDKGLLHNIRHLHGYKYLLPLQERCVEILLDSQKPDLLVQSPTGTGKTAAFCIPAVQTALTHRGSGPSVIIICNTQNLALQISDHLKRFAGIVPFKEANKGARHTGLSVFNMFKGGDDTRKLNQHQQPDVVIATMGKLNESLTRKALTVTNLQMFIVDEADKMVSLGGFSAETTDCMRLLRAVAGANHHFQVTAFSATFSQFEDEDEYGAIDFTSDQMKLLFTRGTPVVVRAEGEKGYITQRVIYIPSFYAPQPVGGTPAGGKKKPQIVVDSIKSTYHVKKLGWLCALLDRDRELYYGENGKYEKTAVIFVERVTTSNFLATYLMMKGYHVAPLNSNFDQKYVKTTLTRLVEGEIQAVISTNKMARGQDIPDLHHVIIYEMSGEFDDYKHRIGRTGRIGKGGLSTALVTNQDRKHFGGLYHFMKEHNQEIPEWLQQQVVEEQEAHEPEPEPFEIDWGD